MSKGFFVCLLVSVADRHVGPICGHGCQPSHGSVSGKIIGYHYTYDDHKKNGGHFLVMGVRIEKVRFAPAVRRDREWGLTTVPSATDSGWIGERWIRLPSDQHSPRQADRPRPISPGEGIQKENAQVISGGTVRLLKGEKANEHKANC